MLFSLCGCGSNVDTTPEITRSPYYGEKTGLLGLETALAENCGIGEGVTTWETDADGNLLPISHGIEEFADGTNTVKIRLQVSSDQVFTAFEGTLTK